MNITLYPAPPNRNSTAPLSSACSKTPMTLTSRMRRELWTYELATEGRHAVGPLLHISLEYHLHSYCLVFLFFFFSFLFFSFHLSMLVSWGPVRIFVRVSISTVLALFLCPCSCSFIRFVVLFQMKMNRVCASCTLWGTDSHQTALCCVSWDPALCWPHKIPSVVLSNLTGVDTLLDVWSSGRFHCTSVVYAKRFIASSSCQMLINVESFENF